MPINYFPALKTSPDWGNISGSIENQDDLKQLLSNKADANHSHKIEDLDLKDITDVPNQILKRYYFDGNSSYFELQNSTEINFTDGISDLPFTLIAFVSVNNLDDNNPIIAKYDINQEFVLFIDNTGRLVFRIFAGNFTQYIDVISDTNMFEANQAYNIEATYDGSGSENGLNIFLNGVNISHLRSNNLYDGIPDGDSKIKIGNYSAYYFNGYIWNIAVFNIDLNQINLEKVVQKGEMNCAEIFGKYEHNIEALLHESEAYYNVWCDLSGNGRNAIPYNIRYGNIPRRLELCFKPNIQSNIELTDFIPAGYQIIKITAKVNQGASAGKLINIGLSGIGSEISNGFELSENIYYDVTKYRTHFNNITTIYINDNDTLTAWNYTTQLDFDLTFTLLKLI